MYKKVVPQKEGAKEGVLLLRARIIETEGKKRTMSSDGGAVAPYVPVTTSAVLMTASKHLSATCRAQNKAFLDCKRADADPEKCLHRGLDVTRCTLSLLKELHEKCPKEMDAFAKCMDYYGNEFKLCRKQQEEFHSACPLKV